MLRLHAVIRNRHLRRHGRGHDDAGHGRTRRRGEWRELTAADAETVVASALVVDAGARKRGVVRGDVGILALPRTAAGTTVGGGRITADARADASARSKEQHRGHLRRRRREEGGGLTAGAGAVRDGQH